MHRTISLASLSTVLAFAVLAPALTACKDDPAPPDGAVSDTGPPDAEVDAAPSCQHPEVTESCQDGWCAVPAGCFQMGAPPEEPCREKCWTPECFPETYHPVTLTHAFEIAQNEVTQVEHFQLRGYNRSYYKSCGDDCPVEMVSWHEAVAYCNALSEQQGLQTCYTCSVPQPDAGLPDAAPPDAAPADASLTDLATIDSAATDIGTADAVTPDSSLPDSSLPDSTSADAGLGPEVQCQVLPEYDGTSKTIYDCPGFRLPTVAEWEYAYRAGTITSTYAGDITNCTSADPTANSIGWYSDNSGKKTHPVGGRQANAWGIHDMAGNVWEWCHDRFQNNLGDAAVTDPWGPPAGLDRTMRGGSCWSKAQFLRAAFRDTSPPAARYDYVGFRCVRTASTQ